MRGEYQIISENLLQLLPQIQEAVKSIPLIRFDYIDRLPTPNISSLDGQIRAF